MTAEPAKKAPPKIDLKAAVPIVEEAIQAAAAEAGPREDGDREWWNRRRAIMDRCAAALTESVGAKVNDHFSGCRIRIADVAASSTMGFQQAVQNWLAAARKRLAA